MAQLVVKATSITNIAQMSARPAARGSFEDLRSAAKGVPKWRILAHPAGALRMKTHQEP